MMNRFALLLLSLLFLSCSTDQAVQPSATEEQASEVYGENEWPQQWQLVEMSGNMWNVPPQTGDDMEYQEWYVLHENGSFTKTRKREDVLLEAKGTYAVKTYDHGTFIEFSFETENSLIGNCDRSLSESLHVAAENKLEGVWLICDGPGLVYERVKYDDASVDDER